MEHPNTIFKVKVFVSIQANNIQRENVEKLRKEYIKHLKRRIDELNEEYRRIFDGGTIPEAP